MRIAIIGDALDYQYAGVFIYTKEIIEALAKANSQHTYLIIRQHSNTLFEAYPNVKEVTIPVKNILGYGAYRLFFKIPRILTQLKADIVLEPRHFGPFNLPRRIRRVTFIHDLTPIIFPQWHQFPSQFLQKWFLPSILRRTDHIITNSHYTKSDIAKLYPSVADKTTVIHLGKDEEFHPNANPAIIENYGIKDTNPYFLYVGTIEPRKNLFTLISAFEQFRQQTNKSYQLVLAGKKGWKSDALFSAIEKSPFAEDIIVTGYVARKDLPVLYTQADLFIYPSFYEGFGLSLLEAMACGTPVLTANTSSMPEIAGQAAHYFNPHQESELLKRLIQLVENEELLNSTSHYAAEQMAKFSWAKAAKEHLELFEQLVP